LFYGESILPKLTPDAFRDTDEMGCGSLMIALMKAIRPLQVGQILQVRACDPGAPEDIPAWCRLSGHQLLDRPPSAASTDYFIRRGNKP
jgi:tRNA 2-thiouridine synthesizing protein A